MSSYTALVITDVNELESDQSQAQEMDTEDQHALEFALGWEHAIQSLNDTMTPSPS